MERRTKHVRMDATLHHQLAVVAKVRRTTTQELVEEILRRWAEAPEHAIDAEIRRSMGGR